MTGVVLQGTGGQWHVRLHDGAMVIAALRGRVKHGTVTKLAVGDEVLLSQEAAGDVWTISEILPRRSRLSRRNPSGARGERIVAANVDQVLVVVAMVKPEPNERMIDRFLVIAEANELAAHLVINKVELAGEDRARARFAPYQTIGYPTHFTSARQGLGLAELHEILRGRVTALSGPSGVGKSSLLNALYPGLNLRVGAISESVNKGRHTTVGALMHPLPDGGFVVDTPGLREVGLWGLAAAELDRLFPEFRSSLGNCRFADCRHLSEPDCAVRDALARGDVTPTRYESYVKLREEAEESEQGNYR